MSKSIEIMFKIQSNNCQKLDFEASPNNDLETLIF